MRGPTDGRLEGGSRLYFAPSQSTVSTPPARTIRLARLPARIQRGNNCQQISQEQTLVCGRRSARRRTSSNARSCLRADAQPPPSPPGGRLGKPMHRRTTMSSSSIAATAPPVGRLLPGHPGRPPSRAATLMELRHGWLNLRLAGRADGARREDLWHAPRRLGSVVPGGRPLMKGFGQHRMRPF
jgi:hypothetical protein